MKKRLLSLLLAVCCLAVVAIAVMQGGSSSDPLISQSYLNGTYLSSVLDKAQEQIDTVYDEIYEDALDYLETVKGSRDSGSSAMTVTEKGVEYTNGFQEMRLKKGDTLLGTTGTGVFLLAGEVTVSFQDGALINVTKGETVPSGANLAHDQRYLVGENSKPSFVVESDTAVLSADGYYTLKKSTATDYNQLASALQQMGLFKGKDISYGSGYALEDQANRIEGLIMFLRMIGQEEAALACQTPHPFQDVPEWCNGYVAYAYEKGYTKGVSSVAFGTYQQIGAKEYVTFLLRALGYRDSDGEFSWDTSLNKARSVGVITAGEEEMFSTQSFYRAQMVYISYYGLLAQRKSGETLLSYLDDQGALQGDQAAKIMSSVTSNRIL